MTKSSVLTQDEMQLLRLGGFRVGCTHGQRIAHIYTVPSVSLCTKIVQGAHPALRRFHRLDKTCKKCLELFRQERY